MSKHIQIFVYALFVYSFAFSQQFEMIPPDILSGTKPIRFGVILCTTKGTVLVANSMWLSEIDGMQIQLATSYGGFITDSKGNKQFVGKNSNIFKDLVESNSGIKLLCEGPDKTIYVVDENNNFGCIAYRLSSGIMIPPFNFSTVNTPKKNITAIWMDRESNLFAAANTDTIYFIAGAGKLFITNAEGKMVATYMNGIDADSNFVVTQGARTIKKFTLGKGIVPYSFTQSPDNERIILIGTNNGLYGYDKQTGQNINYFRDIKSDKVTITGILVNKSASIIWFSTLEKGMGRFNTLSKSIRFFEYPKKQSAASTVYPILNFSAKSQNEFFVAVADSLPAVFNIETGNYAFINDSIFHTTENKTTDIKADAFGNLYITKGGGFYWSETYLKNNDQLISTDSSLLGPYITDIMLNGVSYNSANDYYFRNELLKEISLKYKENKIEIYYSCRGIMPDSLILAWKLDNYSDDWTVTPYSVFGDKMNMVYFDHLSPGKYTFRIKARKGTQPWLKNEVQLIIIVAFPFWQTWWFWLSVITGASLLVFVIVKWRVNTVRKQERLKTKHEKELLELEAKALRAQMNPHFIFNCMNSIKLLMQQNENEKAINYLTTFSKLIRTIFQNSGKREITLYDEIETCKLYTRLESMRFADKFSYAFSIDETIDLKLLMVPALIIQPFIENAIWHGIMPKEDGGCVKVIIKRTGEDVLCIIDDDGIGRETSRQNKFQTDAHESKGVHLTQSRIDLDNLINQRNASLEIVDKIDEPNTSLGTRVILTFKEY